MSKSPSKLRRKALRRAINHARRVYIRTHRVAYPCGVWPCARPAQTIMHGRGFCDECLPASYRAELDAMEAISLDDNSADAQERAG